MVFAANCVKKSSIYAEMVFLLAPLLIDLDEVRVGAPVTEMVFVNVNQFHSNTHLHFQVILYISK